MDQRVSLITLGVDDLEKSAKFYETLGWKVTAREGAIVVFNIFGAVLGLYQRADLIKDVGFDLPKGSGSMTLGYNVREKSEVAEILETTEKAGGKILKPAHDIFWGGHSGYFCDPDGIIWEVAHNPFTELGENGEFQWAQD